MPELLNVWREMGALVRFAEAKNTFLTALLIAYLSVAHSKEWAAGHDNYVFLILFGGNQRIFLPFIAISAVLSAISILPVTSSRFVFLKYRRQRSDRPPNPYYFRDIAAADSAAIWLQSVQAVPQADQSRAERLAEEIVIIARLAVRKFALFRIAVMIGFLGWAAAWIARLVAPAV
jgi:hypothetical protein